MIHQRCSLTDRMKVRIAAMVVVVVATASARADVFVPPGLNPGDMYHLVFVTVSVEDPTSSDIAVYNDFVQAEAAKYPSLTGTDLGVTYRAIASTSSVDARDNALVSAPVYRLDGELVASGFDDMWDGSIQARISLGASRTFCSFEGDPNGGCTSDYVWTGSSPDGRGDFFFSALGLPVSRWATRLGPIALGCSIRFTPALILTGTQCTLGSMR